MVQEVSIWLASCYSRVNEIGVIDCRRKYLWVLLHKSHWCPKQTMSVLFVSNVCLCDNSGWLYFAIWPGKRTIQGTNRCGNLSSIIMNLEYMDVVDNEMMPEKVTNIQYLFNVRLHHIHFLSVISQLMPNIVAMLSLIRLDATLPQYRRWTLYNSVVVTLLKHCYNIVPTLPQHQKNP